MRIITPSVELMRSGLEISFDTPEQFIERVGRTCYKSEDKITNDSAAKFVSNLIKRGHEAMIEHWSLIFRTDMDTYGEIFADWDCLLSDIAYDTKGRLRPHIRFTTTYTNNGERRNIISGNMRAWRDYVRTCIECYGSIPEYLFGMIRNYPLFFPEYQDRISPFLADIFHDILIPIDVYDLTDDERRVHQDVTIKFVCDRGVSHEIVRHRVASFAQESTRYCNYGLDKFGGEITVVRPSWCGEGTELYDAWRSGCLCAEGSYFGLLAEGAAPQEARSVLPSSTKTEIIVTMNLDGWEHFFDLRCATTAQPDMREVALMARCIFNEEVYGKSDEASD